MGESGQKWGKRRKWGIKKEEMGKQKKWGEEEKTGKPEKLGEKNKAWPMIPGGIPENGGTENATAKSRFPRNKKGYRTAISRLFLNPWTKGARLVRVSSGFPNISLCEESWIF